MPRRAQKHCAMTVMAASMHQAGFAGLIRDAGAFMNWQGVHIRTQPNVAAVSTAPALDDPDDAGSPDSGHDLVAPELGELARHHIGGAVYIEEQFGVAMKIMAPGDNIMASFCDMID